MMTNKVLIALLGISLLLTACSPAGSPAAATPEAIPVVKAGTAILAEGRLEPIHYAEIAFNASGMIGEVLVGEGEQVKKGQPLIRLGNESDSNYATARLELISAQKALNDLLNSSGTDLAQAVIDLQDAKEAHEKAHNYRKSLDGKMWLQRITWKQVGPRSIPVAHWYRGYAGPETIADADNDLALKKAELEAAQRAYERLKNGADADQLAVLQARLDAAKAGVAAFSVLAPFDSIVADLNAGAGNSINAGGIAVTVADFSSWLVKTTDLTEIDVVELAQDQPVMVTLDAIPDVDLPGRILRIGQTYSENQGDVVYEVTVLLNGTHPAMRWGMTAAVNFGSQD
jgi:HlyD family secretion protein